VPPCGAAGNEFCERLAFYGLATNLVTYITQVMGGDPASAAIQVSMFEGTCYITPLIGAYLADSLWGRYKTILVFSSVYFLVGCTLARASDGSELNRQQECRGCGCRRGPGVTALIKASAPPSPQGMAALAMSSAAPGLVPDPDTPATTLQNLVLVGSLGIVALGTGGIKPNVSAFGADQFDETDPGAARCGCRKRGGWVGAQGAVPRRRPGGRPGLRKRCGDARLAAAQGAKELRAAPPTPTPLGRTEGGTVAPAAAGTGRTGPAGLTGCPAPVRGGPCLPTKPA
jgi:hypothetical protein